MSNAIPIATGRSEMADGDRERIIASLFPEGENSRRFQRRFAALMTMAVLIAVLGLMANSTAVVIGAMLVAPLMTPLLSTAAALVMGWGRPLLRHALLTVGGASGAVALATVASLLIPGNPNPIPPEILARTSPNLLDLGVALVAGSVAAYALVRHEAIDALSGVAVAVALVPPLSVVGITLQLGRFDLALGAGLLFLANVTGIVLSAAVTFLITGLVPRSRLSSHRVRIGTSLRWALMAVLLMMVPLRLSRSQLLPAQDPLTEITAAVDGYLDRLEVPAEVVSISVLTTAPTTTVEIVLVGPENGVEAGHIADLLANQFNDPVAVSLLLVEASSSRAAESPGSS